MKNAMKILITISLSIWALHAQANDNKQNEVSKPDTPHQAGMIVDSRFDVNNINFFKKFSNTGKGEFLDFTFDLVNKTDDGIKLKMFIIAFNEKDESDIEMRKFIEYPQWRKLDFEKNAKHIVFFDALPVIDHTVVADFAKKREDTINKNAGLKPKPEEPADPNKKKKKVPLQDFIDYVVYVHENPQSGVDLELQGFENARFDVKKELRTEPKPEGNSKPEELYRITLKALKTSVNGRLYSKYRMDKQFFNHIGLVLYDTDENKIVYRRFFRFKKKFRIR